jgi:hypothetical protein
MRCWNCGCIYCWDTADESLISGARKYFCCGDCQEAYAVKRALRLVPPTPGQGEPYPWEPEPEPPACPHPAKQKFKTKNDAVRYALHRSGAAGIGMNIYRCETGTHWHITSRHRLTAKARAVVK